MSFSPFSSAITSLVEERANLSALSTFVRFALVWFCLVALPLGVCEGLRLVIVALPGLFCYLFFLLLYMYNSYSVSIHTIQLFGFAILSVVKIPYCLHMCKIRHVALV